MTFLSGINLKKSLILLTFIILIPIVSFAQNENLQIGGTLNKLYQSQAGYYDYSEPSVVNIKVSIWGFVKYPGKFIIPAYSSIKDLISYAGGPTDEARLEELRILRTNDDSSQTIIRINYKDFLMDTEVKTINTSEKLKAGDVLLVSGYPRFYLRDYISVAFSVASLLLTLIILIRQK
jgi:hypothetical protein